MKNHDEIFESEDISVSEKTVHLSRAYHSCDDADEQAEVHGLYEELRWMEQEENEEGE